MFLFASSIVAEHVREHPACNDKIKTCSDGTRVASPQADTTASGNLVSTHWNRITKNKELP